MAHPASHDSHMKLAHRLADLAGAAVMPHFRSQIAVENKEAVSGFDPVTAADRDAERAIAAELARVAPDHGIVGEEFGTSSRDARLQWVIDPIDGTRAFIMGYPLWGTLIGLLEEGKPVLGVMDQPYTGERFSAVHGGAAQMHRAGGSPVSLKTRPCSSLDTAILSTTHPDLFAEGFETERFAALRQQARMTRYGGDCYAYAMLAAGHVDLIVEAGLKAYDVVALIPIIEAAGGRITTWDGGSAVHGGRIVAAGDPRLHDATLELLS